MLGRVGSLLLVLIAAGCVSTEVDTSAEVPVETTAAAQTSATTPPKVTTGLMPATTSSPTTTAAMATTSPAVARSVVLNGDGINDLVFGTDTETVIAELSSLLGTPDDDTGFVSSEEMQLFGFCGPGSQRSVSWGSLHAGFVDSPVDDVVGFVAYVYEGYRWNGEEYELAEPPLSPLAATSRGLTVFYSIDEAETIYGDLLEPIYDSGDIGLGRSAILDLGWRWRMQLWLDVVDSDVITRMEVNPCGE